MNTRLLCPLAFIPLILALAGCDYVVPLTAAPTRAVQQQVLGEWAAPGDDSASLTVRQLDEQTYIAVVDGDAYRVHHSDFADLPFVSVQDLNSSDRKYCIYTWQLAESGRRLVLRRVSPQLVPDDLTDIALLQRAIEAHRRDAGLLGEETVFLRR